MPKFDFIDVRIPDDFYTLERVADFTVDPEGVREVHFGDGMAAHFGKSSGMCQEGHTHPGHSNSGLRGAAFHVNADF